MGIYGMMDGSILVEFPIKVNISVPLGYGYQKGMRWSREGRHGVLYALEYPSSALSLDKEVWDFMMTRWYKSDSDNGDMCVDVDLLGGMGYLTSYGNIDEIEEVRFRRNRIVYPGHMRLTAKSNIGIVYEASISKSSALPLCLGWYRLRRDAW